LIMPGSQQRIINVAIIIGNIFTSFHQSTLVKESQSLISSCSKVFYRKSGIVAETKKGGGEEEQNSLEHITY
jgi:hypothetical protein